MPSDLQIHWAMKVLTMGLGIKAWMLRYSTHDGFGGQGLDAEVKVQYSRWVWASRPGC